MPGKLHPEVDLAHEHYCAQNAGRKRRLAAMSSKGCRVTVQILRNDSSSRSQGADEFAKPYGLYFIYPTATCHTGIPICPKRCKGIDK